MKGDYVILFLIGFPMLGGLLSYLIGRFSKRARDYSADVIVMIEFLAVLFMFKGIIVDNKILFFQWDDFSGRGINFTMDGFRYIYGSITAFMWMMTTIFSREYFGHYHNRNRYYTFNLITLGATMGVFLSADLFTTYIFFEVMSLTSYVWVVHDEKRDSLSSAQTYLAVSIIGGLVMLMGLFLLQHELGTLEISQFLERAAEIENKTMLYLAGLCLFVGFGAKAGVFPFHIWLPKAHSVAPAPASALLSGILTKTGVFGIIIISCYLLNGQQAWGTFILFMGVITMFTGATLALFSIDLKRTLACSSMSQIGFIMVGIGMQGLLGSHNAIAARGTFLHMINHSLIKLVLFMVAGVVVMNIHKLNLNQIQGFGRKKPLLHFAFLMGGLGITGIPLWNGYISKTLLHESIVEYIHLIEAGEITNLIFPLGMIQAIEYIFLISGGITIAYMMKLYFCLFIKKNNNSEVQNKYDEMSKQYLRKSSRIVLIVSSAILPIMGLFPTFIMDKLADIGQGFMNGFPLQHQVEYFALINILGAIISITIGLLLYYSIVRTFLMKTDEKRNRYYSDSWPKWLDLEEKIYRPLLIHILPMTGKVIARMADGIVDGVVVALRKTVYKDRKIPQELTEGNLATTWIGRFMDLFRNFKNRVFHIHSKNAVSYVHRLAVLREEIKENNTIIGRSLSFGLLMFCFGLALTLIYMLFL